MAKIAPGDKFIYLSLIPAQLFSFNFLDDACFLGSVLIRNN